MKLTTAKLTKLVITDAPALDPIHVYAEDIAPSRGSLLVRCFDRAWYAYWGAMGTQKDGTPTTVRQFVLACDSDYIAENLVRGNNARITDEDQRQYEDSYVTRIAEAIKLAFKSQEPRPTKQRQDRLERLAHANALIKVISDHGRRFFWNHKTNRVACIEMDARGRLWWIDDYKATRVSMEKIGGHEHRWYGFSHGGTLKDLVRNMRDYIKTGERISLYHIAQDCWGYSPEGKFKTREAAKELPIISS